VDVGRWMFDPGHSLFCPTCACIVRRGVSPPRQCCPARTSENLSHLDGKPADLATFRQAWANECPYVIITTSVASSVAVRATAFCCLCFVSCIHFWWWVQGGHVRGVQRLQLFTKFADVDAKGRLGIVKPHSSPFRPGFCFNKLVRLCFCPLS